MHFSQLLQPLLRRWPNHRSAKKKKSQSDDDDATTRLFHAFWQEDIMAPRTSYGDTDGGNVNKKHFHEPAKQAIASHTNVPHRRAAWHTVKKAQATSGGTGGQPLISKWEQQPPHISQLLISYVIIIIINPSSVSCATDTTVKPRLRRRERT
jgi:hypothetical protein